MKNQDVSNSMRRLLALLTAIAVISGVLAVIPAIAASRLSATPLADTSDSGSETMEAETEVIESGNAYPGYVVLDADYINANLSATGANGAENGGVMTDEEYGYKYIRLNAKNKPTKENPEELVKHNDPYISLNMNSVYDADVYNFVTIIARPDSASKGEEGKAFELFFDTDSDSPDGYQGTKLEASRYSAYAGFQALTYDFSNHAQWHGKINKVRLDFYNATNGNVGDGDYCDIAFIILSKTADYAYDSAYDVLKTMYTPVQVLKDFDQSSTQHFNHAPSAATEVTISDGSVFYKSKAKDNGAYDDPYVAFWSKEYLTSVGRENEILKTGDFSYTVIKFRTSDHKELGGMQLFVYTNEEKGPIDRAQVNSASKFLQPSRPYAASQNYNWQTTYFNMDNETLLDNPLTEEPNDQVSRWRYTENFNGFRVDWSGNGTEGAFLEMDEIMFFKTAEEAIAFSMAVNTIKLPTEYPYTEKTDEGEELILDFDNSGYQSYDAYAIDSMLAVSEGVVGEVNLSLEGWSSFQLNATGTDEAPYALLRPGNLMMDANPNLTFIVKGCDGAAFKLYYKTVEMSDYDDQHSVKAKYRETDDWQIISFDMRNMPDLIQDVNEFKIEFLADADAITDGAMVEILSLAICESNDAALRFVENELTNVYMPKQVIRDFGGGDEGYLSSNGSTKVSYNKSNKNVLLTMNADETSPSVDVLYKQFMVDSAKYKAISTDDFKCIVIQLNGASSASNMELFLLDSDRNPAVTDISSEGTIYCSSGKVGYGAAEAQYVIFDMLGDGVNSDSWFGELEYLRLVWADEGKAGDRVEISQIYMFEDKSDAQSYFDIVGNFEVILAEPDVEQIPEETLPGDIEEETETKPSFDEDTTEPDETVEDEESSAEESTVEEETADNEETTSLDETTETEETEETESESDSESEEDGESEEEGSEAPPSYTPPTDLNSDGGAGDGETQRAEGSKTPFVVACISLSGLSGASIISVIAIRLKLKILF